MDTLRQAEDAALDPEVSALIVSYNTRDLLLQAISSVHVCRSLSREVIVVDNASIDGSVEAVRSNYPETRILQNTSNVGFARAVNQGLRAARGDLILLLNTDAWLEPGALEQLVSDIRAWQRAAIVGPRLVRADGSVQRSARLLPSLAGTVRELLLCPQSALTREGPVYQAGYVFGACCLIRSQALKQVGPFDERFFMYFEETDWCRRAGQNGWTVLYDPRVAAVHLGGQSTRLMELRSDGLMSYKHFYASEVSYFRKYHGWMAAALVLLARLLHTALVLLRHTFLKKAYSQRARREAGHKLRMLCLAARSLVAREGHPRVRS